MRFGPGCQCCDITPRVCNFCTTQGGAQIPSHFLISIQDLVDSPSPAIPSASPCCDDQEGTYCLAYDDICKWDLDTFDHCNLTVNELTLELTLERRDGNVWVVFKAIDKGTPANYEQFEIQVATSPSTTINCENDLDGTVVPWVSSGGSGLADCTWTTATVTILSTDCSPSVDSCDHCTATAQYMLITIPPLVNGDCVNVLAPPQAVTGCPNYGGSYIAEYVEVPPLVGECIWQTPWLPDKHTPDRGIVGVSCSESGGEFQVKARLTEDAGNNEMDLTITIAFRDGAVQANQGIHTFIKTWPADPGPTTPTIDCEAIDATADWSANTHWACTSSAGLKAHALSL